MVVGECANAFPTTFFMLLWRDAVFYLVWKMIMYLSDKNVKARVNTATLWNAFCLFSLMLLG